MATSRHSLTFSREVWRGRFGQTPIGIIAPSAQPLSRSRLQYLSRSPNLTFPGSPCSSPFFARTIISQPNPTYSHHRSCLGICQSQQNVKMLPELVNPSIATFGRSNHDSLTIHVNNQVLLSGISTAAGQGSSSTEYLILPVSWALP